MKNEITKSGIALAVEPLRTGAVERAVKYAKETIANMTAKLEAAEWNLDVVAPYPYRDMERASYMSMKNKRNMFQMLFETNPNNGNRMNDPVFMLRDEEAEARFIKMAAESASIEFDAYVVKLVGKVGEHSTARVTGSLWDYSVLTVETPAGVQRWKTQQILNVSKLNKVFNQYPTRKMK